MNEANKKPSKQLHTTRVHTYKCNNNSGKLSANQFFTRSAQSSDIQEKKIKTLFRERYELFFRVEVILNGRISTEFSDAIL